MACQVIAEIIEQHMAKAIDVYLDQLEANDAADRPNGYYRWHLLTELGDIELNVPRTRRYSPGEVVRPKGLPTIAVRRSRALQSPGRKESFHWE